jgi:hypothetical protein
MGPVVRHDAYMSLRHTLKRYKIIAIVYTTVYTYVSISVSALCATVGCEMGVVRERLSSQRALSSLTLAPVLLLCLEP